MRLSTRSRYGIRLILDITRFGADEPVSIKEIAERQDISIKYLEKIAAQLKQAGFIKSRRGAKGGYQLGRQPAEISVGEVVRCLEGEITVVDCVMKGRACDRMDQCISRSIWKELNQSIIEKLSSISLEKMICEHAQPTQTGRADFPLHP